MLATSEAIGIGERFGLDRERMLQVFNASSGRSFSSEYKFPTFVLTESWNSGCSLNLMTKDVRTALDLADGLDAPSTLARVVLSHWQRATEELRSDADHTEIARWVNRDN
jgi:3-hydroxyisobutyrate dehydrogenase